MLRYESMLPQNQHQYHVAFSNLTSFFMCVLKPNADKPNKINVVWAALMFNGRQIVLSKSCSDKHYGGLWTGGKPL